RGSVLARPYYASREVVPHCNAMAGAKAGLEVSVRYLAWELGEAGIRVHAISAGPLNTLAARGIAGFTGMLQHHREKAPLRRNIEHHEVGDAAVFLASSLSSGITGEVLYVDAGYNVM